MYLWSSQPTLCVCACFVCVCVCFVCVRLVWPCVEVCCVTASYDINYAIN